MTQWSLLVFSHGAHKQSPCQCNKRCCSLLGGGGGQYIYDVSPLVSSRGREQQEVLFASTFRNSVALARERGGGLRSFRPPSTLPAPVTRSRACGTQGSIVPFQTWTHLLAIPGVLPWVTKHAKPDLKQKRTDAVAVLIASHAGHTFNRVQIAVNLSRLIPLHVYGKVTPRVRGLNPAITSPPRPDCPPSTWYDPVITPCLLSPYPFTLAFENSMADDYASEKVYNPLLVGSVPVYAGAPNIENLVPPRSIIRLSDFATLEVQTATALQDCRVNPTLPFSTRPPPLHNPPPLPGPQKFHFIKPPPLCLRREQDGFPSR